MSAFAFNLAYKPTRVCDSLLVLCGDLIDDFSIGMCLTLVVFKQQFYKLRVIKLFIGTKCLVDFFRGIEFYVDQVVSESVVFKYPFWL